jgi:plastin-1
MFLVALDISYVKAIIQFPRNRNGLSTQAKQSSLLESLLDDTQDSREERVFRLWINSLGNSTYINNVFEDVRNG